MKLPRENLILALAALISVSAYAGPFSSNSLVVLQVGNNPAALTSSATPGSIAEFTTNGTLLQTISIPATGGTELTWSGTATTDGQLAISSDGTIVTFAGYVVIAGSSSPVSATAAAVNRAVGVLDVSGNYSRVAVSPNACNGANARGAVSDGQNFWLCGDSSDTGDTNGGIWYSAGGAAPIQVRAGNLRAVNIVGNSLWCSAAASTGPYGIHSFGNLPAGVETSSVIFGSTSGTGNPSPTDFAVRPDGTLAYVADDRAESAGGGIQRWTNNGSVWGLDYTLSVGGTGTTNLIRRMTVDFSGTNPVIYATTSEASANRLIAITDAGPGAGSSYTVLATAGTNTVFRGVAFSPAFQSAIRHEPPLRALFVGDSLLGISTSYSNDIPAILVNLASNLGVPLTCTKIASNGWALADHVTNAFSTNTLSSGDYDLVVLQEKSQNPSLPSLRDPVMFPACRTLNGMVTNHGERTMFYETWGFIDGDTTAHCGSYDIPAQYEDCDGGFGSFLSMNIATREAYTMIGGELSAAISPVGLAWARVRAEQSGLNLYILDDSLGDRHPNSYGAYLAACVFYSAIFGRSPEGSTYYSTNSVTNAVYLQRIAAETVLTDPFATDAYGFGSNHFYWAYRWQDYTNPPGSAAGTVVISGASASPSPSVKVDANIGGVTNLVLGTLDTNYSHAGEGRLYLYPGGALAVSNALIIGNEGKGFVVQNGGSLAVGGALTLAMLTNSTGQFTLSNGQFYATQILRGDGSAQFNFTGGQIGFKQFGSALHPFNLSAMGGTVSVTNTSPATVYGSYTQGSSGTLSIQLGASSNAVTVSGAAILAGRLQVSYAAGFQPSAGQQFVLLLAASVSSGFTNVALPAVAANGLGLVTSVTATSLVATVANFAASLSSPTITTGGAVQFTLTGIASQYILQTSTNLTNWTALSTNTVPYTFTTTNINLGEKRFYRALYVR